MTSFKVICIDGGTKHAQEEPGVTFILIHLEIYNVIEVFDVHGIAYYILEEHQFLNMCPISFNSKYFAPLSAIDEATFIRETNTQTV